MAKAVDFEKIRRRRQRVITLKRCIILAGVMLLVGACVFFYQIMVEEGATITLSDLTESFGGTGFPADMPGGIVREVGNIGDNLTVLNDTNLYIYSPKAKVIRNIQRMTEQTIAIAGANRVLTYTLAGKSFQINSVSRQLYSKELDYGIICADMNHNGDFAIVAPVKQFASKVYVFNRRFEEIYSWSSPEYVTDVSVSPKGDMMALNCIGGDGGALESLIYIFRFNEDKEKATVAMRLADSLCMDITFIDEHIAVITDKRYLILDEMGEKVHDYDFSGLSLEAIERYGKNSLLLLRDPEIKTASLVLLDANLNEKARVNLEADISDMTLGKDGLYTLNADGIHHYDNDLRLDSQFLQRNISRIYLIGNKLYYLTRDEINLLAHSELVSAGEPKAKSAGWARRGASGTESNQEEDSIESN